MMKETFKQRKIGKQLVSVMMLGLTISPIVMQTHGVLAQTAHVTTNEATKVTDVALSAELKSAIDSAKSGGLTVNAPTAKTQVKTQAEADKIYKEDAAKIKEATTTYAAAKAAYDKQIADAKSAYDTKLATYNKALETAKANTAKDGYLSKAMGQSLKFESEPSAKMALSGDFKYVDSKVAPDGQFDTFSADTDGGTATKLIKDSIANTTTTAPTKQQYWGGINAPMTPVVLEPGKSVKATYTDLLNSSYDGTKISGYEVTYTNKSKAPQLLFIMKDPTVGFVVQTVTPEDTTPLGVSMQYKDANGKVIQFTEDSPALLALASLNSGVNKDGSVLNGGGEHVSTELVKDYNFTFVPITGSSITENSDGIYSKTNNDDKEQGSRFDNEEWDQPDNPNFYYGSGVAAVTKGDAITFTSNNLRTVKVDYRHGQWLAISSKVAAASVPDKPSLNTDNIKKPTAPSVTYRQVELVTDVVLKTKWVDQDGKQLKEPQDGTLPDKEGDDVSGYTFVKTTTDKDGNVTNTYTKTPEKPAEPEKPVTPIKTTWIDEDGNPLKDPKEGSHPDKEGDDVPGYELVDTTVDKDGNINNVYKKKPIQTHWVDEDGKPLKDPKEGSHPDKEGDDLPGYKLIDTTTDKDGNITNVYKPVETRWVDEDGNNLKEPKEGAHPDEDGDDMPGYTLVDTKTDDDGNIINTYKQPTTEWVGEDGKPLKDPVKGAFPDKEGDDLPGYILVDTKTDDDGNVTNTYRPVTTNWVDEDGNPLKDPQEGVHPDDEGDDIPGYELVETKTDEDGNVVNTYRKVAEEAPTAPQTPETPETPNTPQTQEAAPAAKPSTFAQTGAEVTGGIFAAIAAMAVVGLGWFGFKRKDSK